MQKKFSSVFMASFLALKAKLQLLQFEFCQIKLGYRTTDNLQLTGKISLKLDFNLSICL